MNNITIELCREDRIRIDALNGHLSILNKALALISGQLEGINAANEKKGLIETVETDEVIHVPGQVSIDEETADLWDTRDLHQEPAEAPQEVVEEQTPPAPETVQNEPTVTKNDIQQKVIELVGKGLKAAVRDIITTYADNVSGLPDSALVEVWDKLTALEG